MLEFAVKCRAHSFKQSPLLPAQEDFEGYCSTSLAMDRLTGQARVEGSWG